MANKKSKDIATRNALIRKEFEKKYTPAMKKNYLFTELAFKYNLGSESIRMIIGQTNASRTLNKLKQKTETV